MNSSDVQILYSHNFGTNPMFNPGDPNSPYTHFSVPGVMTANDGTIYFDQGHLIVDSMPFKFSTNTSLDHPKYLAYIKTPFRTDIHDNRSLVFHMLFDGLQTGTDKIPDCIISKDNNSGVVDPQMDPRVCCSAMVVVDFENMMVYDFLVTNGMVYALYERLPFNRTEWDGPGPNYTAFTHCVPVYKRDDFRFLNLEISYNYSTNRVRWYIDKQLVFQITNPGKAINSKYRCIECNQPDELPAPETPVHNTNLHLGLGNFSLMDASSPINNEGQSSMGLIDLSMGQAYPTVNPVVRTPDGKTIAQSFMTTYSEAGNTTNFGQGAVIRVKEITVYTSSTM